MAGYDPDNVFAKILRGDLPCHRVYQDERTLAFMDIMPRADGHVLVIPKEPARTILDVSPEGLAATIASVQRVARAVKAAMGADGLTIQQFNESAGGQVVFHLHFHIIPRMEGVAMRPHSGAMAPNDRLAELAQTISRAII
ncbi:HIT family protein [Salinarimonas soli]|uniref:HIT family protein n=1 Tax=Salinarimonas soli TaxID=1638099 RepID=A0A5B2VY30_9HYPH|nr:HIT family protein [Salinarimonas soli]KAA2243945.1 HIT family protein [Salinarimonas soli]